MKKLLQLSFLLLFASSAFSQNIFWKANVTTGQYGKMEVNFIIKSQNGLLKGSTAPDAHKRILGGLKASLAKSMFQADGSLIELDSIAINNEKLTGYLILEKKKYFLVGTQKGKQINAELTGKSSGKKYGVLEAVQVDAITKPKNYTAVWEKARSLTEQNIYNKSALETKEWKNFSKEMQDFAAIAEDDAEFCYTFFYKAKELPFTHYSIQGNKSGSDNFAVAGVNAPDDRPMPKLTQLKPDVMLLDIPAFNFRVSEIDHIMENIVGSSSKNLIIDLRQNTGGDMEGGMRICQYLTDKTLYGGIMLSQFYWNSHKTPPSVDEYKNFKPMNNANYAWFKDQVKSGVEGLCLVTQPLGKTYKGKIYILTSKNTASASEPFVYTLQKEKIATVIGGKTAGAVISMEYFHIDNLALTIPMLDYYTFDGKRLDKVGVSPDIEADPKTALDVALNQIGKNQ